MLKSYYAGDTSKQESTKGSGPPVPKVAQDWGQAEADQNCDPLDVSMLPADELVSLQIGHVIEWVVGMQLEEQPSDVRVEKPLRDAVRIIVMIDMLMVPPMFARPHQNRVLESRRAEDEGKEPDGPASAESDMRGEPMKPERNTESAGEKHDQEKTHLEPIQTEVVEVKRNAG